jgi:hypothetical protein
LRLNPSVWTLCVVRLLTASLSLNLRPSHNGQYHSLEPWANWHWVHLNAVSYLSKYRECECEFFY